MEEQGEILVEVKGLSKKFSRTIKQGMWLGLKDILSSIFSSNGKRSELRTGEFWAVKDINFTLRRGECLGLIGQNGAGKSSLLKLLNGLVRPDEGSITMRGKVGALLELGAGFNPILTGRENIYLNGQIIGFTKKEIAEKMDAILDFAGIGEFIDSPIQNYSSGMKVRLGFAIASQMEPDVLIIDEVLAVGDLGFVLKCFNTIDKIMEKTAVIFVSHSMPQVSRICSGIILMEKGKAEYQGSDTSKGIDLYYSKFETKGNTQVVFDRGEDAVFLEFTYENETGANAMYQINRTEDLQMNIKMKFRQTFNSPFISISIFDKEQRPIGLCQNEEPLNRAQIFSSENGYDHYQIKLTIPRINLSKGIYSVSLAASEEFSSKPLLRIQSVSKFQVLSKKDVWPPIEFEGKWS